MIQNRNPTQANMKRLILLSLLLSSSFAFAETKTGSLTGTIKDAETQETLIGVNVLLEGTDKGAATDIDGVFSIENVTAGVYVIEVRYIGYQTRRIPDVVIGSNRVVQLDVELTMAAIESDEVVVMGSFFSSGRDAQVSATSFNPEELRRSPGAAQEFSRVLVNLPSVAARGETSQDIMVRGGSPIENGFYIDNIMVPSVQHFRQQGGNSNGPLGIVNGDLIADLEFFSGGFSARYGDRMSSISDIRYREGTRDRSRGDVGLNMAGFTGSFEGGIGTERRGSWMISARRSYLDLIADAINAGGAPSYQDAQAKLVYDLNDRNKLTFLGIYGGSLFSQSITDALEYGDNQAVRAENEQGTAGFNLQTLWANGYTNTSLSYSRRLTNNRAVDVDGGSDPFNIDLNEQWINLRSVSYLVLGDRHRLEFGADASAEIGNFNYFYGADFTATGGFQDDFNVDLGLNGFIGGVFASYKVQPFRRLTTSIGFRGDWNSYNEDFNLAPRLNLSYQLTNRMALNAAYGWFYQALPRYLMSQNEAFEQLPTTRAVHITAGIDYMLTEDTKLTLEVFDKQYSDVPQLAAGSMLNDPSYVLDNAGMVYDNLNSGGESWARGVEVLVQKKLATNLYGMISGSYFRTRYQDFRGIWRNRDFDNQYLVSVIGGYRPSSKWEFSARWTYQGGRPFTPLDPVASAQANDERFNMNQFQSDRMPAFHSMYLRGDRRFFYDRTNLIVFVEIWNAYNNDNIDSYYWNRTDQKIDRLDQFSLLPVGGVRFEF